MSKDLKEKSAEFIKNVKEIDFKEKGAEIVKSVKENETINNTIHIVGEEYNSLRKKQKKGHMVEYCTVALIMLIIGIIFQRLAILVYLVVGFSIYLVVSHNKIAGFEAAIDNSYRNLQTTKENFAKGYKQNVKYYKLITENAPDSYQFVGAGKPDEMRKAIQEAQDNYNAIVSEYNYYLSAFPSNIAAYILGYTPREMIGHNSKKDHTLVDDEPDIDTSDIV